MVSIEEPAEAAPVVEAPVAPEVPVVEAPAVVESPEAPAVEAPAVEAPAGAVSAARIADVSVPGDGVSQANSAGVQKGFGPAVESVIAGPGTECETVEISGNLNDAAQLAQATGLMKFQVKVTVGDQTVVAPFASSDVWVATVPAPAGDVTVSYQLERSIFAFGWRGFEPVGDAGSIGATVIPCPPDEAWDWIRAEADVDCPAAVANVVLGGVLVDYYKEIGKTVSIAVYDQDDNLAASGTADINPAYGDFRFDTQLTKSGEYYASVSVLDKYGDTIGSEPSVAVEIGNVDVECASVWSYTNAISHLACPAGVSSVEVYGVLSDDYIEGGKYYIEGATASLALYTLDGDFVAGASDVPIRADYGDFTTTFADVADGEYYASISVYDGNGNPVPNSVTASPEVKVENTCAPIWEFTNAIVENDCSAGVANVVVYGAVSEMYRDGGKYAFGEGTTADVALYPVDGDEPIAYLPGVPVRGSYGDFRADFSISVEGSYYASIGLRDAEGNLIGETAVASPEVTVDFSECAALVDVAWDPAEATNTCPATTASSVLRGTVKNYSDQIVGVGIYADDSDTPLAGSGDIDVNEDGTFEFAVDGLKAGSYYSSVSLATAEGEQIGETIAVPLTVETKDCPVTPAEKPGEKPGKDKLPNTGAFALPLLLLGGGAIGGGYALTRRSKKH